jgi:hypothetical protein
MMSRKTNRRHMTGDHHGRAAARATLLVTAANEILGRTVLGGLIKEYERAPQKPRSGRVAELWNPHRLLCLLQPPDRITRRRERAWRQPDATGERVTILAAGKCVAACRHAVLRWARRGKICPLYQEGGARDVR